MQAQASSGPDAELPGPPRAFTNDHGIPPKDEYRAKRDRSENLAFLLVGQRMRWSSYQSDKSPARHG